MGIAVGDIRFWRSNKIVISHWSSLQGGEGKLSTKVPRRYVNDGSSRVYSVH